MNAARVRFKQRRLLAAADLRDDVAFEIRRGELHVRAAHGAWGIALGFSLAVDGPGAGVFVGPGLAYDRCGRALVASGMVHVPAPDEDGVFLLVVQPADPRPCCPTPLERDAVGWAWRRRGCVADDEVPLAELRIAKGRVSRPELTVRHGAARRRHARVATGIHVQEGWQPEVEMLVSAAEAGFERTPFYFATLVSTPSTQELFGRRDGVLGPWPELHDESNRGFRVTLRFAGPYDLVSGIGAGETFEIHWIGVESARECPAPELDPATTRSTIGATVPAAPAPLVPLPPTGGSSLD